MPARNDLILAYIAAEVEVLEAEVRARKLAQKLTTVEQQEALVVTFEKKNRKQK